MYHARRYTSALLYLYHWLRFCTKLRPPRPKINITGVEWGGVVPSQPTIGVCMQGRDHVFKVGGPISWSMVLLPFYSKIRQVYPVWCSRLHNHTLFVKTLCKKLGVRPNFGEVRTFPNSPVEDRCNVPLVGSRAKPGRNGFWCILYYRVELFTGL